MLPVKFDFVLAVALIVQTLLSLSCGSHERNKKSTSATDQRGIERDAAQKSKQSPTSTLAHDERNLSTPIAQGEMKPPSPATEGIQAQDDLSLERKANQSLLLAGEPTILTGTPKPVPECADPVYVYIEAACWCSYRDEACTMINWFDISILDKATGRVLWGPEGRRVVMHNDCNFMTVLGKQVPLPVDLLSRPANTMLFQLHNGNEDQTVPFYAPFHFGRVGMQGPQGLQGPQGTPGAQGPQGLQGYPGKAGDNGKPGPAGPQGLAGAKGDMGLTGPKGDKGDKGDAGLAGAPGPRGETGPTGLKGDKGDAGLAGSPGPRGESGANGPKGDKGDTGPAGPQGPRGDTGFQGAKGDKGDTGPAGPLGPKGDPGPAGPIGPIGPKGDQGEPGPRGPRGEQGPAGPPASLNTAFYKLPKG